jgi:hypothetical protein
VFRLLIVLYVLTGFSESRAQGDSVRKNSASRKVLVGTLSAGAAAGSLAYLQTAWYNNYKTEHFHYFNDNQEWQQMDKAGHFYTAYQTNRLMMDAFEWAGFSRKTERWVGGTMGLAYLTAIEVMDGYSSGWGFSWGDETANLAGTALAITQESLWNEQRLQIKFSYLPSGLARYNPQLLGSTPSTRLLKDYNAQAYWLSFSPFSFMKNERKWSWLCMSLGYGATGMTGGHENTVMGVDDHGNLLVFERQRQFYLSLDVDFTKIKTRSRFLNGIFSAINVLKVPAPALVLSKHGWGFLPMK